MTIKRWREAIDQLGRFLAANGMPTGIEHITREHVSAFITDQLAGLKPASAADRYRDLQQFFKFCGDEGEIKSSAAIEEHVGRYGLVCPGVHTDPRPMPSTRFLTGDHTVPLAEGGRGPADNTSVLCLSCNAPGLLDARPPSTEDLVMFSNLNEADPETKRLEYKASLYVVGVTDKFAKPCSASLEAGTAGDTDSVRRHPRGRAAWRRDASGTSCCSGR